MTNKKLIIKAGKIGIKADCAIKPLSVYSKTVMKNMVHGRKPKSLVGNMVNPTLIATPGKIFSTPKSN
ncbi:hypothetical protein [Thomasclavelia sp.]|uniref:hypothetical protein n=1 Tax=Thomasclavelia sp. TaxID=3025757 RepID=UPI00399F15F6